MSNLKNELSSKEKFSRTVMGVDTEASFNANDAVEADMVKAEKVAKFNEQVDAMENKLNSYMKSVEEQSINLAQELEGVDILPMFNYALIRPFEHNPFQRIKVESGIIVDAGGLAPEYKNQENGNIEEEKELVKVGMVVETGHTCQFLKPGDLVFYNDMMSAVNVPFYRLGLVAVNEQRIIAVVNSDLAKRKADLLNNGNN